MRHQNPDLDADPVSLRISTLRPSNPASAKRGRRQPHDVLPQSRFQPTSFDSKPVSRCLAPHHRTARRDPLATPHMTQPSGQRTSLLTCVCWRMTTWC